MVPAKLAARRFEVIGTIRTVGRDSVKGSY